VIARCAGIHIMEKMLSRLLRTKPIYLRTSLLVPCAHFEVRSSSVSPSIVSQRSESMKPWEHGDIMGNGHIIVESWTTQYLHAFPRRSVTSSMSDYNDSFLRTTLRLLEQRSTRSLTTMLGPSQPRPNLNLNKVVGMYLSNADSTVAWCPAV
jgi:hypothetical protein